MSLGERQTGDDADAIVMVWNAMDGMCESDTFRVEYAKYEKNAEGNNVSHKKDNSVNMFHL